MTTGVQFIGSLAPNQTKKWFTFGWSTTLHVVWYMMPTTPLPGNPELSWEVAVERANATQCTYWLTVTNLTGTAINFEGRFAILN
jgi:hypothetical protein